MANHDEEIRNMNPVAQIRCPNLFNEGIRPAINIGISVSRVCSQPSLVFSILQVEN
jgi:hypothetical protein